VYFHGQENVLDDTVKFVARMRNGRTAQASNIELSHIDESIHKWVWSAFRLENETNFSMSVNQYTPRQWVLHRILLAGNNLGVETTNELVLSCPCGGDFPSWMN
jgi:hypothetical protein